MSDCPSCEERAEMLLHMAQKRLEDPNFHRPLRPGEGFARFKVSPRLQVIGPPPRSMPGMRRHGAYMIVIPELNHHFYVTPEQFEEYFAMEGPENAG